MQQDSSADDSAPSARFSLPAEGEETGTDVGSPRLSLTPEEQGQVDVVSAKVAAHKIKRLRNLINPVNQATVSGQLRKYWKARDMLAAIWRWIPDFALKIGSAELKDFKKSGTLHPALQIGNYFVDWTDSSLVAIRSYDSCKQLVAQQVATVNVYEGDDEEDLEHVLRALASHLISWNLKKNFHPKKASPLSFVLETLAVLGVSYEYPPLVMAFLSKACSSTPSIKDPYTGKKVTFKSHADLDEYLLDALETHPQFADEHSEVYLLLQTFDRHFWTNICSADVAKWHGTPKPSDRGCPLLKPAFVAFLPSEDGGLRKKTAGQIIQKRKG